MLSEDREVGSKDMGAKKGGHACRTGRFRSIPPERSEACILLIINEQQHLSEDSPSRIVAAQNGTDAAPQEPLRKTLCKEQFGVLEQHSVQRADLE